MAFNEFGKVTAASAVLTHRPAGPMNLLSEIFRTSSLQGDGTFICIAQSMVQTCTKGIGCIPTAQDQFHVNDMEPAAELEADLFEMADFFKVKTFA